MGKFNGSIITHRIMLKQSKSNTFTYLLSNNMKLCPPVGLIRESLVEDWNLTCKFLSEKSLEPCI